MDCANVDVAILCGGLGTRLRSEVSDRPKPMASIEGIPFVRLLMSHVASFGFRRFVLCLGYKAGYIQQEFSEGCESCAIEFSTEGEPLGTGGGLRHARALLRSDPVLVLNGDSFCNVDYPAMLDAHAATGASVTLAVAEMELSGEYGRVVIDDSRQITGFEEKAETGGRGPVNAGIYLFRNDTIQQLPGTTPLSLETEVFPSLAGKGLHAYRTGGTLLDIGTPERYRHATQVLKTTMARTRP